MILPKFIDAVYDGPRRIDRYDLVAEIAWSGTATVFLANPSEAGGLGRLVAIERLHPHLESEREFIHTWLAEARTAARIRHLHVISILEVCGAQRGGYLVREYIEGDTLAGLMARAATSGHRLPVHIGARIIVEVLAGLNAAHELRDEQGNSIGPLHRALSPQNIIVGIDGTTRIKDFGFAAASSRLPEALAGPQKSKLAYMAPEQAMGNSNVDRRADVFSSGIVLWEVLAARRLFKADSDAAALSRVVSERIPDVREVDSTIDPDISAVVMTALQRDRDARYPTCRDFQADLDAVCRTAGVLATSSEVAGYVTSVIGRDIVQQREGVRAWLSEREPRNVLRDSGPSARAPAPQPRSIVPLSGGSAEAPASVPAQREPPAHSSARSRTPIVIAVAAIIGFAVVGLLALAFGGGHTGAAQPTPPAARPHSPEQGSHAPLR